MASSQDKKQLTPAWKQVDAGWYLKQYNRILSNMGVVSEGDVEAFYHEKGVYLGHSPNPFFDEEWYVDHHKDVGEALIQGKLRSGFEHYCNEGYLSRSPHWLFNEPLYLKRNDDITRSFLDEHGYVNGYDHYLQAGDKEFRSGSWFFDPEMYLKACEGPPPSDGTYKDFLRQNPHYASKYRLSWYFDPIWYLDTYPHVREEIEQGIWKSALHHYLCNKDAVNYDPNEFFSEEFYGTVNPDVSVAIEDGRLRNFYGHFLSYGVNERRKPSSNVDLQEYFSDVSVQRDIDSGRVEDVFCHYVMTGGQGNKRKERASLSEEQAKALYTLTCEQQLPVIARSRLDFSYQDPEVSVIVVAHNRFAFTMATLASLRNNFPRDIQLIFVDSGSKDNIRKIENYIFGMDILRYGRNIGFLAGCNEALKEVKAKSVLYLNNDAILHPHALENAIKRLWSNPKYGAVGAKVIRTHGRLQEAGSIIWRDGSVSGYLRDEDPNIPEANFVRKVDYCAGVFLLVKTEILQVLEGFDEAYMPAYFEETDLCVRIHDLGFDVIYDPSVVVTHYECATSDMQSASRIIGRNHQVFRKKNAQFLRHKTINNPALVVHARSSEQNQKHILFIEDRLPYRKLGSGFTRSNDIISVMASLGHQVTLYPIYKSKEALEDIYGAFPDSVEVIYDRELPDIEDFLRERSGYYDAIWIARTHNVERLAPALSACAMHIPDQGIIADTEAVAAYREVKRLALEGKVPSKPVKEMLEEELRSLYICQTIVAVNDNDLKILQGEGFDRIEVLGHMQEVRESVPSWGERQGILFVGAIHEQRSPNMEALSWFSAHVLPILDRELPEGVFFAFCGYTANGLDFSPLRKNPRVKFIGAVDDIESVYDQYRVFVAPTRYAAGIAYKVHEAAANGIPIVASPLLCQQAGWKDGEDILSGDVEAPEAFAAKVMQLYNDQALWEKVQRNAREKIRHDHGRELYTKKVEKILSTAWSSQR